MFREMRRKNQNMSKEESISVLEKGTSGVLALCAENDYPYAVPLSYVYHASKLFFHSAGTGHKLDMIAKNQRVSFCVIDQDQIVPEKLTTYFRSVIVFGRAEILKNDTDKKAALEKLVAKYSSAFVQEGMLEIEKLLRQVCVIQVSIEHMTGKEAIELVREKEQARR